MIQKVVFPFWQMFQVMLLIGFTACEEKCKKLLMDSILDPTRLLFGQKYLHTLLFLCSTNSIKVNFYLAVWILKGLWDHTHHLHSPGYWIPSHKNAFYWQIPVLSYLISTPISEYCISRIVYRYLVINIADTVTENIIQHFQIVKVFLDECFSVGGKALVHGNAGISRSAAVVLGFIMEKYRLSYE